MSLQLSERGRSLAIAIGLAPLAMALMGTAQAAHVDRNPCPADFTQNGTAKVYEDSTGNKLTAASSCEYLTPADNNYVANETNLNHAGFFGFTDWDIWDTSVSQVEPSNGQTGTWAIPDVDFATYDYIITFKDGAGTNLVSFLFNELYSSGGWDSPFTEPPFTTPGNGAADVSHYSIARRVDDGTPPELLPEPSTIALLGLGILGLGFGARRSMR